MKRWLNFASWGLYKRIMVPIILLILIAGTARSVILVREEAKEARENTEFTLRNIQRAISPLILEYAITGDYAAIAQLLKQQVSDFTELKKLEWYYGKGVVSAEDTETNMPAIYETTFPVWFPQYLGLHSIEKSTSLSLGGANYGELRLTSNPSHALEKIWLRLKSQIKTILAIISILSILIAVLLHNSLSSLRALTGSMRRFHLDHNVRASERGSSETRTMSQAFNLMAEELSELVLNLKLSKQELNSEKIRAEVTLMSIGDAVMTTDATGRVTLLNSVAENLTGWSSQEAAGLPVEQVFHIINQGSRKRVSNPVSKVLSEGVVIGLDRDTILIARDGREYPIEDSAAPIRAHDGTLLGCVLVFHDVTEKQKLMQKVNWQAWHDILTGLPNRALLSDRLQQAVANADRSGQQLAVCFLDVDEFKPVNDQYGHDVGDRLLVEASNRISNELRGADTLARLGGDEFVILLTSLKGMQEIEQILHRVLKQIGEAYVIDDKKIVISASIGVAVYPLDKVEPDMLLRHADIAMYQAKQNGRNRFHIFDIESDQETHTRMQQIQRSQQALLENEFRLFYQPKVNMRTGQVVGMEALIRWQHPERGLLSPCEFLPLLEQTTLMVDIGGWVLEETMRQIEEWRKEGGGWPVSINQAARDFMHPDFVSRLKNTMARHPDVPPNWIELEVLETAAIDDLKRVSDIINECHQLGVTFALDDFGTGYSSLSYLKALPADCLKIDQSFVHDMLDDKGDLALVEGVISLAHVFQRKVIAEGVESPEHGVLLLRLGCELAQGYGIAKPMPANAVAEWVSNYRQHPTWSLWANVHWELKDFPLLVAQYDHLRWVKNVMNVLEGDDLGLSQAELSDHHQCRFGHWYYGQGVKRYSELKVFTELESVHARVHEVGQKIINLHHAGDKAGANEEAVKLQALKGNIVQMLAELQRQVANLQPSREEIPNNLVRLQ